MAAINNGENTFSFAEVINVVVIKTSCEWF